MDGYWSTHYCGCAAMHHHCRWVSRKRYQKDIVKRYCSYSSTPKTETEKQWFRPKTAVLVTVTIIELGVELTDLITQLADTQLPSFRIF